MSPSSRYWIRSVSGASARASEPTNISSVAVADRQRAALAGDHQQLLLALEQDGQREGAVAAGAPPRPRPRAGPGPARDSALTRCATTSVSVWVAKLWPCATSSARSARKFSMMPLWTSATPSLTCGWALVSLGTPWVAQRVWPMPVTPPRGSCLEPLGQADRACPAPAAARSGRPPAWRSRRCRSRDTRAAAARPTATAPPAGRRSRRRCHTWA